MINCIILPVRSGSKGLQDKNIREFCGVPLLGYVLQKLSSSGVFENIIVSSDSQNYLDIAHKYGATDLIKRPAKLATIPQQPIRWSTHVSIRKESKFRCGTIFFNAGNLSFMVKI